MLDLIVDSLDNVPEHFKSEYTKGEDGKFHLSVSGVEDVSGLKSALQKERDEAKKLREQVKAFDGIDPSKANEALEKLRKLEEKQLLDSGEVDKVIENRTRLMQQDHQAQVAKLTEALQTVEKERDSSRLMLSEAVIQRGIIDAVNEVGQPRKEALLDIIQRGKLTWRLDEKGAPIPVNEDGTTIYGKDGKAPMTMKEWGQTLLETAPHLFLESKGGGARGSVTGGNGKVMSADDYAKLTPAQKLANARGAL